MSVYDEKRGWGIVSLVFAIASIAFLLLPFLGVLFAILALIFSFVQHDRLSRGAKRIAIASLLLNILFLFIFAMVLGAAANKIGSSLDELQEVKDKISKAGDAAERLDNIKGYQGPEGEYSVEGYKEGVVYDCPGYCVSRMSECDGEVYKEGCDKGYCCV